MSARCEPPIAPDYLDALVAEVAALRAERSRAMKVEVSGELLGTAMRAWVDSCGDLRATLAAVIPAIQAEALERAAVVTENVSMVDGSEHIAAAIRALKMTAECRPPEGTPPGSVFDLIRDNPDDEYPIIGCWCEGDEWCLWGGRRTMTPAEVAAEGWRIDPDGDHVIAEPPADG